MAKSRKASSRQARSHRCKYGMLKHPVKTPSGGKRICKKRRSQKYGGNKGDESRSRRDYSKHHSGKGLSLAELKKIAKAHGIKRYSSLKRASLKAKLTRAGIKEHMSLHKSRKHSKKKSRSHRCKYGMLKHAVKTPSGRKRVCRKSRGSRKHSKKKSRSRKHSKKKSRSHRCKYGMLKHAVKTPSGRKRVCRKSRGSRKHSKKKSRSRKHSKKKSHKRSKKRSRKHSKKKSSSRRRRSCKFGMLKTPVKTASGGKRYCKKRRSQKYGGNKGDESKSRRDYRR